MCYCHIMYKLSDSDWLENSTPPKKKNEWITHSWRDTNHLSIKTCFITQFVSHGSVVGLMGTITCAWFYQIFYSFCHLYNYMNFYLVGSSIQVNSLHLHFYICFIYYTFYSVSIYLSIKMVTIRLQHNYSCLPLTIFSVLKWEHRQLLNYPLGIKKYFV